MLTLIDLNDVLNVILSSKLFIHEEKNLYIRFRRYLMLGRIN